MTIDNPLATPAPAATKEARAPGAFAGIPISDYIRDGAALVLLLVSLAMPWNFASHATGRIEVILITLLSVFSLSITYLARAGVFPPSVTVARVWMLRLVSNVPYAALVVVYLVIDVATGFNFGAGGVGFAASFGLAGAILAAQPREAEIRSLGRGATVAELWYRIVAVIAAVAILSALVSVILTLVRPGLALVPPVVVIATILQGLLNLAGISLAYVAILRRSEVGRLTVLAIGVVILGAVLVDLFAGFRLSLGGVESIHAAGGYAAVFLCALAGLAASAPLRLAMNPIDDLTRWLRTASVLLIVSVGLAAFVALFAILALIQLGASFTGFGVGILVTAVAIALIAVVARTMLRNNPAGGRVPVLSLAGLMVLLGVVHVVLSAIGSHVGTLDLVLAFGLPLAVGYCLTVPSVVRDYYRVAAPAEAGAPSFVAQVTGPAQPARSTSSTATVVAEKITQALDPGTPPEVLYQLAQDEPELRPYLAANPATYPELLTWLGQLGDPAVDAALQSRSG